MPKRLRSEVAGDRVTDGCPRKRRVVGREQLCARCASLKLKSILNDIQRDLYRPIPARGKVICNLGDQHTWSASCPLCRFFSLLAAQRSIHDKDGFKLRLVSRRVCSKHLGKPLDNKFRSGIPMLSLAPAIDGLGHSRCCSGDYNKTTRRFGYISWLSDADELPCAGRGRILDPKTVDIKAIDCWLKFCLENHTDSCARRDENNLEHFQVIDCHSNLIVPASPGIKYLALSYVWGTAPANDSVDCTTLLWERLPQTIRDAIDITKRLGYRFLWIDRYCIPKDPEASKNQIQRMNIIYMQAHATLIAAAGKDATFGLPGAGLTWRRQQPTIRIGGYTLFSTLPLLNATLSQSAWMTRAWTFQEGVLSRRRIIFTDEQVFYECNAMQRSEVLLPDLDSSEFGGELLSPACLDKPLPLFSPSQTSLLEIWHYTVNYANRKLTYDDDSLNGILGMFAYFCPLMPRLRHFFGIPFSLSRLEGKHDCNKPDKKWSEVHCTLSVTGEKWLASHCFLNSLSWQHSSTVKRRRGFPSWSWTGWEGSFGAGPWEGTFNLPASSFPQVYSGCDCNPKTSATIIGAEDQNGRIVSWQAFVALLAEGHQRTAALLRGILVIDAWTVQLHFKYLSICPKMTSAAYYAHAEVERAEFRDGPIEMCQLYSMLWLNSFDANLRLRLKNEDFTGVLLGCSENGCDGRMLVLDQQPDGTYERIGTVSLLTTTLYRTRSLEQLRYENNRGNPLTKHGGPMAANRGTVTLETWRLEKTWRRLRLN